MERYPDYQGGIRLHRRPRAWPSQRPARARLTEPGATRIRELYWATLPRPILAAFAPLTGQHTSDGKPLSISGLGQLLRRSSWNGLPLVPGEPGHGEPERDPYSLSDTEHENWREAVERAEASRRNRSRLSYSVPVSCELVLAVNRALESAEYA